MISKWRGASKRLAAIPVPAILFALALGLFAWGILVVTSDYSPFGVSLVFGNRWYRIGFGSAYITIGLWRMVGALLRSTRLLLVGPYLVMMAYLFLALLQIDVIGWYPFTWVPLGLCALIAGICRLSLLYGGDSE
jgi:hypothetical protein